MIHSKKTRAITLILAFILLAGVSQAAEVLPSNSNIGKSDTLIFFEEEIVSANFQVWDANTEPNSLNYTLHIEGLYAANFTIDGNSADVHGESNGVSDKKTHTVDVNYGQLHDIALNARIAIKENNDINLVSYITLIAQAPPEPNDSNGPVSSPSIGKSATHIALAGNVLSKRFQIWNKGTGDLSYTLTLGGDDSGNFTIDDSDSSEGDSNGVNDKQTHTVSVIYDDDFHNQTLDDAWIEIADENDNLAYIDLSATETIATRVSFIAIEQGIDYGIPADGAEAAYDFVLYVDTDETVGEVNFVTPAGITFEMSDEDDTDDEDGVHYWTYALDDAGDLADYGDGEYVVEVNYNDGSTAQTVVNFGIPNKPGTIVWPTQMPVLAFPADNGETVSPVRFEWEKCTDANAGSIWLALENEDSNVLIGREYSKATTKTSGINLDIGDWDATLSFGKWYQAINGDGIEIDVGKSSISHSEFSIMKWFGSWDDITNHTLKLADCDGAEITFKLTGGGKGEIIGDDCAFDTISLSDTTAKSVLTITTPRGVFTSVGDINVAYGHIKAIIGKNVDLEGDITIAGTAGAITLHNVTDSNITIESAPLKIKGCVVKFNEVSNLVLTSETPVRTLQAAKWLDGSLNAPWISKLTIKGDFDAILTLNGGQAKGMTLKSARIAGVLDGAWNVVDGNCGSITFASSTDVFEAAITGSVATLKAAGNKRTAIPSMLSGDWTLESVKTVTAADINQCNISATRPAIEEGKPVIGKITAKGWINDCDIIATESGDIGSISAGAIKDCNFITTDGSVGKIANKGIRNVAYCFINSNVEAQHIGSATLLYPKYDNLEDVPFGLTAGSIDKLTMTLKYTHQKMTWKELNADVGWEPVGDTGDFEINLQ